VQDQQPDGDEANDAKEQPGQHASQSPHESILKGLGSGQAGGRDSPVPRLTAIASRDPVPG
jgi:hypothetical protein